MMARRGVIDPFDVFKNDIWMETRDASESSLASTYRLIVFLAKKYRGRGVDFEDLIQEGMLTAVQAADEYDDSKGSFKTFIGSKVRWHIKQYCAEFGQAVRLPYRWRGKNMMAESESLFRASQGRVWESLCRAVGAEEESLLQDAIDELKPQYRNLLLARLDGQMMTQIAEQRGVKPQTIQHQERLAVARLCAYFGIDSQGASLGQLAGIECRGRSRKCNEASDAKTKEE